MEDLESLVKKYFSVEDVFHTENGYEFEIKSYDPSFLKNSFINLYSDMKSTEYLPKLIKLGNKYILKVTRRIEKSPKHNIYQILLLLASLGTILLDGYYKLGSYSEFMIAYEAPILAMLLLHEAFKYIISYLKKAEYMTSYAIPGIPGIIPLMGFINTKSDATVNRDALFDGAFYPYIAALFGVLAFLIFGLKVNVNIQKPLTEPFLSQLFRGYFNSNNLFLEGSAVGITILFVNFLPATNLDGGLLISSLEKSSLALDLLSIIIMSFLGYFVLALAVIFVQNIHTTEPLDSVSPLSKGRKIVYITSFIIIIALFAVFGTV